MIKPIPEYIIYDWEKVHLACESGDINWLKELLASGIDKNIKNDEGNTPIISAIREKEYEIIDYLITINVDIDGKTLVEAIYTDELKLIREIINQGADINYSSKNGWNVLIHFVVNANYSLLEWFLNNYRPNINYVDYEGLTAIFHASGLGYKEMTKLLIEKGANLSHKTFDGLTLIDWCNEMIENPNVKTIKELIKNATQQKI